MPTSKESPLSKLLVRYKKPLSEYLETVRIVKDESLQFKRLGMIGFYSVAEGHQALEIIREKQRSVVRICGPGDLVGFGNWIPPLSSSNYQLRGLEPSEVHFMPKPKFESLSQEFPELGMMIITSLCKIIAVKDERISALENHSVKSRVSALLLSLGRKFGQDTSQGRLIDLAVDRSTLATLAGTSLESLSRAITELEDDGILLRKRRKILVKNEARLQKISLS